MCEVGIQSERVHTYLSSVAVPFVCIRVTAGEHTGHVCWVTLRYLPSLERPADLSPSLEWPLDLSFSLRNQWTSRLHLSDQRVSPFAWETSGHLPFAWVTSRSLPSVQIYRPYIIFSSPLRKYEHPLRLTDFSVFGWLLELYYFWVFFPVICWSFVRTSNPEQTLIREIKVNLENSLRIMNSEKTTFSLFRSMEWWRF